MATTLANNLISNIPVVFLNAEGAAVPMPQPATVTVTGPGDAVLGADGESVDYTPPAPPVNGEAVTLNLTATNPNGAAVEVLGEFVVGGAADTIAVSGSFNVDAITTRPLA